MANKHCDTSCTTFFDLIEYNVKPINSVAVSKPACATVHILYVEAIDKRNHVIKGLKLKFILRLII